MADESGEAEGAAGCGGQESAPPWVLVAPGEVAGLLLVGLGVGLPLGWQLGQRPAVTATARATSGGAGPGGLPFGARMPDAAGPVRVAVGFVAPPRVAGRA